MLWVPERESYRSQIPKFLTFKGFFSWIYSERGCKSEQEICNARALKSAIPFRLPLEGCKGHQSDTYEVNANDFAIGLLDFFQFPEGRVNTISVKLFFLAPGAPQEIPEAGLSNDLVGREDAHAVDFGSRVQLGGQVATDDLVFSKTHSVDKRKDWISKCMAAC